jgi:gliding motility-associated-like protein
MKVIILHIALIYTCLSFGQNSVSRQVIGSVTGSSNMSFGVISYSVGEAVVSSESSNSYDLNQGFQQAVYAIGASPIDFETSNAFSPNGDGLNDIWVIRGIDSFGSNTVRIFNRWGDEVRSFDDYNNADVSWDGTYTAGSKVPTGTYFYVIELPDNNRQITGWIQITD